MNYAAVVPVLALHRSSRELAIQIILTTGYEWTTLYVSDSVHKTASGKNQETGNDHVGCKRIYACVISRVTKEK